MYINDCQTLCVWELLHWLLNSEQWLVSNDRWGRNLGKCSTGGAVSAWIKEVHAEES